MGILRKERSAPLWVRLATVPVTMVLGWIVVDQVKQDHYFGAGLFGLMMLGLFVWFVHRYGLYDPYWD